MNTYCNTSTGKTNCKKYSWTKVQEDNSQGWTAYFRRMEIYCQKTLTNGSWSRMIRKNQSCC